jgi:hypothetical protein
MQITPKIEELIWTGKAQAKTFVIGGSEKHILPIKPETWVIIWGITYFPRVQGQKLNDWTNWNTNRLTQLAIFSENAYNHFVFRDNWQTNLGGGQGTADVYATNGTPLNVPLYLIHERDISFTFAGGTDLASVTRAVSEPDTATKAPPLDYGNAGNPAPVAVEKVTRGASGTQIYQGGTTIRRTPASVTYSQLQYPVNAANQAKFVLDQQSMPLVHVHYVEIKGTKPEVINSGS